MYIMYMILFNPHNVIIRQNKETKAELDEVTCPRSHKKIGVRARL